MITQGLVEPITDPETSALVGYRMHPGVAEAARDTAGAALMTAVDEELANFWMANLHYGQQGEEGEQTWLVVRAARSAGPYLLRRHRWNDLMNACQHLLRRDRGVAVAGLVLPMTGSPHQAGILGALGRLLQARPAATPGSIAEVGAIVDRIEGVHLQAMLDRLPQPTDPQNLLELILQEAAKAAGHAAVERDANPVGSWDPVLAALHATINGPVQDKEAARQVLDTTLNQRDQQQDWAALVKVLRLIQAGERDRNTFTAGLDEIDATITGRALDLLAGVEVGIDPDSWQQLSGAPDADAVDQFLSMLVAAAGGDPEARELLAPVLEQWTAAADPETQALADVLRRLIAGDRQVSLDGLTEGNAELVQLVLTGLEPEPETSDQVQSVQQLQTSNVEE